MVSSNFKVDNGKIKATDIGFDNSYGKLPLEKVTNLVNLIDPLSFTLGELCEIFRTSDEKSLVFYWVYALAFCLHVYFDFSGYSDMAIGLGRVFGFHFLENFNYPFISKSVSEFWRRWHMSLGTWFRDYVYIPLGGNRVSKWKWFRNTLVVWFLTGFWHGADWTFIVWGLYFALFLLLEKFFLAKFFPLPVLLADVLCLKAEFCSRSL